VLDELDRELERRSTASYAMRTTVTFTYAAVGRERVKQNITRLITRRLSSRSMNRRAQWLDRWNASSSLQLHLTGSQTAHRGQGHRSVQAEGAGTHGRTRGIRIEQMTKELASYLRGWRSYFGFCETPTVLASLDQWIRRRLRSMIWKQWKRGKVRFARLCARGVNKYLAGTTAGSPHGPWRIANSLL